MVGWVCICGWNKGESTRSRTSHMRKCATHQESLASVGGSTKWGPWAMNRGKEADDISEPPQKIQRLSLARIHCCMHIDNLLTDILQVEASPEEPPIALPSPEEVIQERRSTRVRRFPQLWRDFEATSYSPIPGVEPVNEEAFEQQMESPATNLPIALTVPDVSQESANRSTPNAFRIFQVSATATTVNQDKQQPNAHIPHKHPFKNDSTFELLKALHLNPSSKTTDGMDAIGRLISSGKVRPDELTGFRARTELQRLDDFASKSTIAGGPWKTGSVKIKMPQMRVSKEPFFAEVDAPDFEVTGIHYRSLVDIITSKIQEAPSNSFLHTPFTKWWCPPRGATPTRIYGEAYSSDVAVKLFEEIKDIPPPPNHPDVENTLALLMLGSDATHLASFGTASLWPVYVFFGNQSKYTASKPSECAAYHLAYIPKVRQTDSPSPSPSKSHCNLPQLPDRFADEYIKQFGVPPPPDVITHCSRELYHAVVKLILEGSFAKAYEEGILIEFPDGITRRVFPRFYCYMADYPEKSVIAPMHVPVTHPFGQGLDCQY